MGRIATADVKHGTRSRYIKGCRCEPCTEAAREYQRNYRERRKGYGAPIRRYNKAPTAGRSLAIEVKCPRCSSCVGVVNQRKLTTEYVGLVRCTNQGCSFEWLVRLVIAHATPQTGERGKPACGTSAGYTRHRRQGEDPCDRCRLAHSQAIALAKERRVAK